jgi:hypothetical protein
MPQVRFEPTIPVFERAMTVHALDRTATLIGTLRHYQLEMMINSCYFFQLPAISLLIIQV